MLIIALFSQIIFRIRTLGADQKKSYTYILSTLIFPNKGTNCFPSRTSIQIILSYTDSKISFQYATSIMIVEKTPFWKEIVLCHIIITTVFWHNPRNSKWCILLCNLGVITQECTEWMLKWWLPLYNLFVCMHKETSECCHLLTLLACTKRQDLQNLCICRACWLAQRDRTYRTFVPVELVGLHKETGPTEPLYL